MVSVHVAVEGEMRVYIAGPYSADHPRQVQKNVDAAIEAGIGVMAKGHSVFIPHLSHYIHLHPSCPFEYEEYITNDAEWLKVADGILLITGWQRSKGALRELDIAKVMGLKIFYSIEEVPKEGVGYARQDTDRGNA